MVLNSIFQVKPNNYKINIYPIIILLQNEDFAI